MRPYFTLYNFLLFAEAWLFMALGRALLFLFAFKKLLPVLGKQLDDRDITEFSDPKGKFRQISVAIQRAARYSPWRAKCFEQAIAAKMMFKLRKKVCRINFGVKKEAELNKILAHAWLICDNQLITGGNHCKEFTIINSFES